MPSNAAFNDEVYPAPPMEGFLGVNRKDRLYNLVDPNDANAYLTTYGDSFVSDALLRVTRARQARAENPEATAEETSPEVRAGIPDSVLQSYSTVGTVARTASLEVFDRCVTEGQLHALLREAKSVLGILATHSTLYKEQGLATMADRELLKILCNMADHYKFVQWLVDDHVQNGSNTDFDTVAALGSNLLDESIVTAWEKLSLLRILASLVHEELPSREICSSMIQCVRNMVCTMQRYSEHNRGKSRDRDALWTHLNDSGLLGQWFRCLQCRGALLERLPSVKVVLSLVMKSESFVETAFQANTSTGKIFRSVHREISRLDKPELEGIQEQLEDLEVMANN